MTPPPPARIGLIIINCIRLTKSEYKNIYFILWKTSIKQFIFPNLTEDKIYILIRPHMRYWRQYIFYQINTIHYYILDCRNKHSYLIRGFFVWYNVDFLMSMIFIFIVFLEDLCKEITYWKNYDFVPQSNFFPLGRGNIISQ